MSTSGSARAIYVEVHNIGRRVSTSKKQVTWKFGFDDDPVDHIVILKHSVMSGKKAVFLDGREVHKAKNIFSADFDHGFSMPGHILRVRWGRVAAADAAVLVTGSLTAASHRLPGCR